MWLLAAVAASLLCPLANATPVNYAEAINGDIAEAPNAPTFVLDAGSNAVSGTQSIAFAFAGGAVTADRDPFFFSVPSGLQLTGFTLAWRNWQPTGGVVVAAGHSNGLTNCQLRDAGNVLLASSGVCVSLDAAQAGQVDLLSGVLPLGEGTYGWSNLRQINYFNDQDGAWSLDYTVTLLVQEVPTPGSLALAGLGLAGLTATRRFRNT